MHGFWLFFFGLAKLTVLIVIAVIATVVSIVLGKEIGEEARARVRGHWHKMVE